MKSFSQRDIILMDFNPTIGHEQAGKRPAIVVSNNDFQRFMGGLSIVCPITNNTKKFPSHVQLDNRTKINGSVLCEHIRTVDLAQRNAKFIEKCPEDIFEEIIDIIQSCF